VIMGKIFLVFLLILTFASVVQAGTTRTADSCSYNDVKAKYDLSSAGDTIIIPACNDGATWDTGLAVTTPITIQGNGSTGSSKTKLIAGASLNAGIIQINMSSTEKVRVTGIYFDMGTPCSGGCSDRIGVKALGTMTQLRIDNNYFYAGKYQIYKSGAIFGVFDNNTFHNANASLELDGDNDTSWATAAVAGMDAGLNQLYIESNTFTRDSSLACGDINYHIESSQGRGYVARYNTFNDSGWCTAYTDNDAIIMPHGNGKCYQEGAVRGHPLIEIYNNTISTSRINEGGIMAFRGGSVIVHDNTVTAPSGSDKYIQLAEEEVRPEVFTYCNHDSWPAEDQIHNSFFWNNTVNGSTLPIIIAYRNTNCIAENNPYVCCTDEGEGTCDDIINENQDYFLHAPQATGGKETLYDNGSTKFTHYYADGGHSMTFSSEGANAYYPYTPYTYPHPLRNSTATVTGITISGGSIF